MNGADLIAEILRREGVEILPAFPHSDLIEAAAKAGIRPIIVRQERHALHIADGYARVTGGRRLCATTVQYGPGSENALGAIAQCYGDNVPVLHIPGGYPMAEQGTDPNFHAARAAQGFTKRAETVMQADRIVPMARNAFAMLRNGRPGPVMLEVPVDVFTAGADASWLDGYVTSTRSAPVAAPEELDTLADRLLGATCPVIVAGQGILYAGATAALVELAERLQVPVMTTLNGKSGFPEDHALALGCGGGARPDHLVETLDQADLIVGLGTSLTRSDYITPLPVRGVDFAQLTNWEGDLSKDYPVSLGIIGDADASIRMLNARLAERVGNRVTGRDQVAEALATSRRRFEEAWQPLMASDESPINPYRVLHDLARVVDPSRTILTHEAGSPRDQVTPFWQCTVPNTYIGWGKTTQLGMSLGLIQGAKLARPDMTCVNIMGDAAIGMTGMDFETAVRNRIGTLTIVLKNSVMGGYTDYHPAAADRFAIHELGGNYAALATALGGYGERVEAPADIIPALERALAKNADGIPALVECITSEEKRMPRKLPGRLA